MQRFWLHQINFLQEISLTIWRSWYFAVYGMQPYQFIALILQRNQDAGTLALLPSFTSAILIWSSSIARFYNKPDPSTFQQHRVVRYRFIDIGCINSHWWSVYPPAQGISWAISCPTHYRNEGRECDYMESVITLESIIPCGQPITWRISDVLVWTGSNS